jgi:hypothetical protein
MARLGRAQPFAPIVHKTIPADSPDVTLALSGVAAVCAIGLLTAGLTLAAAGVAAAGTVGSLGVGAGLSGVSATGSAGTRSTDAVRVGIDANAFLPTVGDFTETRRRQGFKKGSSTGVNYLHYARKWEDVETADGVYDWQTLEWMLAEHPSPGRISITISAVDFDGTKCLPGYLGAVAFNHATVLAAYNDMLDDLFTVIGDRVEYVSLGQEVEGYLSANPTEIDEFSALIDSAKTKVTALWSGRPTIVSFKASTAIAGTIQTTYADVLNSVSMAGITYYFINGDFTIRDSNLGTMNTTLEDDILDILIGIGGVPIIITEFGCPTHPDLGSSEAHQAQFVQHGLGVCQVYKGFGLITHVNYNWLHEWDEWLLDSAGLSGSIRKYIGSLGLHRTTGLLKSSFNLFDQHLQAGIDAEITVALTGVAGASSIGTLVPTFPTALTGQAAAGASGSLQVALAPPLTSVLGTGSPGTISPSIAAGLTGIPASTEVGTLTPTSGQQVELTGVAASGSVGTIAPVLARAASGNAGTGSVGSVAPTLARAIAGEQATGAVGSMAAQDDHVVALSGVQATGSIGELTAPVTLIGVQATGAIGNLGSEHIVALSGVVGTASIGTITPTRSFILSGHQAAGAIGSFASLSSVVPLTGIPANGQIGSMSGDGAGTASLTGVVGTGAVGSLTKSISNPLVGEGAAGALGVAAPSITRAVSGVSASGVVGSLGRELPLSGVEGTGATGASTPGTSVALSGVATAAAIGSMIPLGGSDAIAALTGVQATALLGDLGANEAGVIDVVGEYVTSIDVVGEYVTTIDATGEYITTLDIEGESE